MLSKLASQVKLNGLLHAQCYLSHVQLCGANPYSPFYASAKIVPVLQYSQATNKEQGEEI